MKLQWKKVDDGRHWRSSDGKYIIWSHTVVGAFLVIDVPFDTIGWSAVRVKQGLTLRVADSLSSQKAAEDACQRDSKARRATWHRRANVRIPLV